MGAVPLSALADTTEVDNVDQICEPSATECLLSDSDIEIVPDITLDFGDRPFIVSSSAGINIPTGSVVIQAQGFTLESGGTLQASGCDEDACGNLTIETDSHIYLYGDVTLQGDIEGGDLTLDSDGPIVITGKLTSNGSGGFSKGGNIHIDSADNLQVDEIDISGSNSAEHNGGSLVLISHNGITLNDKIDAVGWAGGSVSVFSNGVINMIGGGIDAYARGLGQTSGDIDLRSQVEVSIGSDSKLDVSGQSGRRNDGGTVYIRSAGSVVMAGLIQAAATASTGGSDADSNAGSVRIDAGTTLSLSGEIDLNSAAKASWGGMVMLNAGQTLNQINRIDVSAGLQGGEVHMLSAKDIMIAENIDADTLLVSETAGKIWAISRGGKIEIRGSISAKANTSGGLGGEVDFEACDLLINNGGGGTIHTTGDGVGSFRAAGSESMTINSSTNTIRAGASNSLFYLRDLPVVTAFGVFSPSETKTEDVNLGLCKPPFDGFSRRPVCDVDGDGEYNRRFGGTDCNDADPEIVGDSPSCICGPVPPPRHGETPTDRCAVDPYPLVFPLAAICPEFVTDTGEPDTGTTDTGTPDTETPDTGPPDGDGSDDTANVDGSGSDEVQATAGAVRCGCASNVASGPAVWLFGLLLGLRRRRTQ